VLSWIAETEVSESALTQQASLGNDGEAKCFFDAELRRTPLKIRIASLTVLCLALVAVPAWAQQWPYDNGPINGTTDAWTINFGYVVSDTFVAGSCYFCMPSFSFGVWEFPGDTMSSVDWSITSGENSGTVFGSGTASGSNLTDKFISTNQFGYDIDLITVPYLDVTLTGGTTYWLNLQNAAVPSGDPVYWDENSGQGCRGSGCPSKASESAIGTVASEAFTVTGTQIPEPSIILLFGSSALCLVGMRRRKFRNRP
jgi:PEP-CTERM motif